MKAKTSYFEKLTLQSSETSGSTEIFDLRLAFTGPGKSKLATTTSFSGELFGLSMVQSFNPDTRILSLSVSIENRSDADLWRPITFEVQELKPASAKIITSDNDLLRSSAVFNFGQQLGEDGKLGRDDLVQSHTSSAQKVAKIIGNIRFKKLFIINS